MKESQFADVFGAALQKELDRDMLDVSTEIATGTAYRSGQKVRPNYEHIDVFQRQSIDQRMKMSRQNGKSGMLRDLIQPDDPNKPRVMVVLPNE